MHASAVLPVNPGLSLLLAIEGAQSAPGALANNTLYAALLELHEERRLPGRPLGDTLGIAGRTVSPDGSRVVTGARTGDAVQVWDASTGALTARLSGESFVGFSQDGSRAAMISGNGLSLWDTANRRELASVDNGPNPLSCADFSPDGARIVTSSSFDATARIWGVADGRMLHALSAHVGGVVFALFSPDGAKVVTCSRDATARIWDAASGKELLALEGHPGTVLRAVFNADGSRVVTTGEEGTDRLWNATNGKEILVLKRHGRIFQRTVVKPDGSRKKEWTLVYNQTGDPDPSLGMEIATDCRGSLQFERFNADGSRFLTP